MGMSASEGGAGSFSHACFADVWRRPLYDLRVMTGHVIVGRSTRDVSAWSRHTRLARART